MSLNDRFTKIAEATKAWLLFDPRFHDYDNTPSQLTQADYEDLQEKKQKEAARLGATALQPTTEDNQ